MHKYGGAVSFVGREGGVNIFATNIALPLRVGMRRYGGAVSFV